MITKDEQNKIIRSVLKEVKEKGCARVGFHAKKILGDTKSIYADKSKIEATITASKRYRSRVHPNFINDFEILKNPDYKFDIGKIILTAILSLIVSSAATYYFTKDQKKEINELKIQIINLNKRIDSINSPRSN
jgi:hypothetical protein